MGDLRQSVHDARAVLDAFIAEDANLERIETVAGVMAEAVKRGAKILAIGNGGSMCDAMHFCEELTGRFVNDRTPLPAIACSDPSHLTCVANDFGFEHVFSRWVEALGSKGDILVALSTSGDSPNIIAAANAARQVGITVIGLAGRSGGELAASLCDHAWIVPSNDSARIQEIHMIILHTLVQGIEQNLGHSG